MESYKKKSVTKKISKIDKDLKYLENFLPDGIVKDCLKDKMKSKKRSPNQKVTYNLKEQTLRKTRLNSCFIIPFK